jgi:hypothetical protein
MPTSKQKKEIAIGGGAAAVAAPFTPTRVTMPKTPGNRRAGMTAAKEGKASVADLRSAYRGMGGRLGNDSHTARLAQSMKEKVREDRPIELKRFRNGETMMVGGHHRVAAAEMIGLKELPTHVTDSSAKRPYSVVPLYGRSKYKRDVKAARTPGKQMTDEQIAHVANKKTPRIHQSINSTKSRVEEGITALKKPKVGIPVALGAASIAGGAAYKNKDKIVKRDSTPAELARAKRQQANLSTASALLGATALGTKGTAYGYNRAAKRTGLPVKSAARLARAHKLDKASLGILTTAAGIGSVSGLRFAHVQREEAKQIEKRETPMVNAFGVSHEYVISKGKHSPPNETTPLKEAANKSKVTLKAIGSNAKKFSSGHPYLTTAAIGAGIGGAVLAPGIMASEGASRRRVKRTFGKGMTPGQLKRMERLYYRHGDTYAANRARSLITRDSQTPGERSINHSINAHRDAMDKFGEGRIPRAMRKRGYTPETATDAVDRSTLRKYPRDPAKSGIAGIGKARGFDPEARRERRQKVYGAAALTTAGGASYAAVKPAKKAVKQIRRTYDKGGAKKVLRLKTLESKPVQQTLKRGGVAGAALLGAGVVASQARNSGRRYNGWYS